MVYNWWKSGNPDMIIRMADDKDVNYLFKKGHNRIPIGPTERAVFIKNGKMLGLIDQDTIKIADEWTEDRVETIYWKKDDDEGRFKRFMRKIAGVEKEPEYERWDYHGTIRKRVVDGHINILLVDSTTIDLDFPLTSSDEVYSADAREKLTGKLIMRFEFDSLNTPKQMNLLSKSKAMTVKGLENRLRDEMISEVVKPVLSQYNSDEIYGNREVREFAEMAVMNELEKTFYTWGVKLQKVIFNLDTPERVKADHELEKKKAEIDQEMAEKELEWKKAQAERLHRKEIEDQQWQYEIEKKDREREYRSKVEQEKMEWEEKIREKTRVENRKVEEEKMELDKKKHELKLDKEKGEIDLKVYQVKELNFMRKERELTRQESRQKEAERQMWQDWEWHKQDMDEKEQELRRKMAERQQAHSQEMEKMHNEHLREIEKGKIEGGIKRDGIEASNEQIRQLQREIHELEMKITDAPTEKLEFLQRIYESKTEQLRMAQQGATDRQLGTVGGETAAGYMAAKKERASLERHLEATREEREHQTAEKSRIMDTVDKTVESMQRVQEAQAGGLSGGKAVVDERSSKEKMMEEFKELKEMKEEGLLTEEEFEERRKKLLENYGV